MDDEVKALKKVLEQAPKGTDGRRIFSASMRSDAANLADRWREAGKTIVDLADALGITATNLWNWRGRRRKKDAPNRTRRVKVVEEVTESAEDRSKKTFTALLPSGVRIEGLTLVDVLALAEVKR